LDCSGIYYASGMSRWVRTAIQVCSWVFVLALLLLGTAAFFREGSGLFPLLWLAGLVLGSVGMACLAFALVAVHRHTGKWIWPWTKSL
jgi:hypothetical protein